MRITMCYPTNQWAKSLKGERTSTREMALRLYRDGGVGRFYRGLGFTVLRAGPVAGVLLPTFDLTLYFLRQLR